MILNEEMSYKLACEQFKDKPAKSGRAREQQLARWNKIAEVEKIGRGKYIIRRKFNNEEIQDIKDSDNYSKYLQAMLLNFFANNEHEHTYTYRELREHLDMVNSHYFPVKYGHENVRLTLSLPIDIKDGLCEEYSDEDEIYIASALRQERKWFDLAESHDKDKLRYAINQLLKKNLISSCTKTYMFYKIDIIDEKTRVIKQAVATPEQVSKLDQTKLEFVKAMGLSSVKQLYGLGFKEKLLFQQKIDRCLSEFGYNKYARAFTIIRPYDLKSVVDYFAPRFNKIQVEKYLTSSRFDKIEPYIHKQLTDKLIKKGK